MIRIFSPLTAIILILWTPVDAMALPLKAGVIGYGDLIPLPALVIGTEIATGLEAELTGGTLLVAGAADIGLKYRLPLSTGVSPTFSVRSGFNYSLSISSL
ncbi:MAG: hypothetical protein EOP09_15295, partial [Proteobacteria bacterium]